VNNVIKALINGGKALAGVLTAQVLGLLDTAKGCAATLFEQAKEAIPASAGVLDSLSAEAQAGVASGATEMALLVALFGAVNWAVGALSSKLPNSIFKAK
jgi:hypothetical protein